MGPAVSPAFLVAAFTAEGVGLCCTSSPSLTHPSGHTCNSKCDIPCGLKVQTSRLTTTQKSNQGWQQSLQSRPKVRGAVNIGPIAGEQCDVTILNSAPCRVSTPRTVPATVSKQHHRHSHAQACSSAGWMTAMPCTPEGHSQSLQQHMPAHLPLYPVLFCEQAQ